MSLTFVSGVILNFMLVAGYGLFMDMTLTKYLIFWFFVFEYFAGYRIPFASSVFRNTQVISFAEIMFTSLSYDILKTHRLSDQQLISECLLEGKRLY